ncbi:CDP-diacylglycerol-glycerol-3-phosphate 3-phosphatidyltransferase [Daldinia childiae]|uniref:CDP-diacylglycerol-glycerol-3-phosphate 3-phosphatidyltransferase n=1 Tax=Daldinia childiae TaxID=326645 RepID=UPI0014462240|nr:CDP-diacylglycerol-glycerol-3-phosphate 3-phosphatidyltransferase [Daldinia childiae]KAF3056304.1 CDP-diacylglycerol-glycerol-3-phosphate 3-phosphatidyltransferase [Daldinia childiae]
MIARGASRCCLKLRPTFAHPLSRHGQQWCRRYSIPSSPMSTGSASSSTGMLAPFVNELDRIAPSFQIDGSQIQIIKTPTDFYETLKTRIRSAKKRIFLSTLYIGKSEKELIATLQDALRANPELKLSILTDALRGTREAPNPSCASLLAPLIAEFGSDRVEIRMYHTPNLTGFRKKHIPKRINEGWGLQHMKLYGIDDEIILSGANLSNDYFTNRQDRYHLFSSSEVTTYFWRLYQGVTSLSFLVEPTNDDPAGFKLSWPSNNAAPSPLDQPAEFISKATPLVSGLIARNGTLDDVESQDQGSPISRNTKVYMLGQLSQLMKPDSSTELPVMTHILKTLAAPEYSGSSWTFTAGYFNPAPSLTNLLLSTASQNNVVITASPYANGFYKSKGVSGLLPDAYTLLARRFLRTIKERRQDSSVVLKEWRRGAVNEPGGWTYHAKGLWITLPNERDPAISIIGSSNYTKRSYSHDLEAGALIVTQDGDLKKRLGDEQKWLQEYASPVTLDDFAKTERRVGLKVRIAMWIVSLVGGAL